MTQTLRLASIIVLLTSPLSAQSAVSEYSIVELGFLSRPPISYAHAINDRGQVVGGSHTSNADDHPILWEDGKVIDLGLLAGGRNAIASAINNRGQVVGSSEAPGCWNICGHAFLWEDGTMTDLGASGQHSWASAINDAGQIVGVITTVGPVLWEHGAIIDLGTFHAVEINNLGQIVGYSITDSGIGFSVRRPFIWQDGVMSELPGLSSVIDINDGGQILGMAGELPVLWEDGTIIPLDLPPETNGVFEPSAINERGQVAGTLASLGPDAVKTRPMAERRPPYFAAFAGRNHRYSGH